MIYFIKSILPALQVARIALVFTAISNIWMVTLLSYALRDQYPQFVTQAVHNLPLWALLACTATVASGMYIFGMTLNDVLDARHDRTFAPSRPIPSGRISTRSATGIALVSLLIAITASVPLGPVSTLMCVITAGCVIFYDALGKHLPGVGIVMLGLIRAIHMLIANPALGFAWGVWLTMTHIIGLSAAAYSLEGKRPILAGKQIWLIVSGWIFASMVLLAWMNHQGGLSLGPQIWIGPTLAAVVFIIMAIRIKNACPDPRAAGGLIMKRGLLWLIVYDASWLASAELYLGALALASLIPATLIAMSLMRRMIDIASSEPDFRRD